MATMRVAAKPETARMKVAQISKAGGDFEIAEREVPAPGAGQVRIKVQERQPALGLAAPHPRRPSTR